MLLAGLGIREWKLNPMLTYGIHASEEAREQRLQSEPS